MQAAPRHDVRLAGEDFGGALFHAYQLEPTELAARVIEKQIDAYLFARGRTERYSWSTPSRFSSAA